MTYPCTEFGAYHLLLYYPHLFKNVCYFPYTKKFKNFWQSYNKELNNLPEIQSPSKLMMRIIWNQTIGENASKKIAIKWETLSMNRHTWTASTVSNSGFSIACKSFYNRKIDLYFLWLGSICYVLHIDRKWPTIQISPLFIKTLLFHT